MALGGGNETRIGLVLLLGTHIGNYRRARKSDETGELRDGDFGWRGHGGVHLRRGHGRDVSAEASRGNRDRPPKYKSTTTPRQCQPRRASKEGLTLHEEKSGLTENKYF